MKCAALLVNLYRIIGNGGETVTHYFFSLLFLADLRILANILIMSILSFNNEVYSSVVINCESYNILSQYFVS